MKKLLLILLFFYGTAYAEDLEYAFIPLGGGINMKQPAHLIEQSETPYSENFRFNNGNIEKRFGITTVRTFDGEIHGYWEKAGDYALVVAHNGLAGPSPPEGSTVWEWDKLIEGATFTDLNATHLTETSTHADWQFNNIGGGTVIGNTVTWGTFAPDNDWSFCNLFDQVVGYITVMCNGSDYPHKYIHANQQYEGIYADWQERRIDYLLDVGDDSEYTNRTKPYYPQAFYSSLYFAGIASDGYGVTYVTETGANDMSGVIWSEIGDSSDFSVTEYYQQRPEGGTDITGLSEFKDFLVLAKEDSIWQISPYANFKRITQQFGLTSNKGLASAENVWINDKGRILDIQGQWISEKVHELLASTSAGEWDISIKDQPYHNKLLISSGTKLFVYDKITQIWEMYAFDSKIEVLAVQQPGKPFEQWAGRISLHDSMTVCEEDITSDYVIKFGSDGKSLGVMNHFSSDDNESISTIYTTRQESLGDTKNNKRVMRFTIQGTAENCTFDVYGWFGDAPTSKVTWDLLGSITLNSKGIGYIKFDRRGIWCQFRIKESSAYPTKLSKFGIGFVLHTGR